MVDKNHIVVGIDFGTTLTKFRYVALWRSPRTYASQVYAQTQNPHTRISPVPSRIAYQDENPDMSDPYCWGGDVRPGMSMFSWFKLLLNPELNPDSYYDQSLEAAIAMGIMRRPKGRTPAQVVSDFLRGLHGHILGSLQGQLDRPLADCAIDFRLTFPVTWSTQAKLLTKEAAIHAGIGPSNERPHDTLSPLLTEPAAAMTALTSIQQQRIHIPLKASVCGGHFPQSTFPLIIGEQRRDVVCVCDCGGGTVDVACYEILSVQGDVQYTELTAGTGTLCGGTTVDRELYTWMTATFGKAFTDLPLDKKWEGSAFMQSFQRAKLELDISHDGGMIYLDLEMALAEPKPAVYDAHGSLVKIPRHTFQRFFAPAIEGISTVLHEQFQMVQEQLGEFAVNKIVLTGGFSTYKYVFQWIKANFGGRTARMSVHTMLGPWFNVAEGAALWGIGSPPPSHRFCPRHYGLSGTGPFDPDLDQEQDAFIDPIHGKRVGGLVTWVLRKGERYASEFKVEYPLDFFYREGEPTSRFVHVFCSDADKAPRKESDPGVATACHIHCEFSHAQLESSLYDVKQGRAVYLIKYKVLVIFDGAGSRLCFEAFSQGQSVGSQVLEFF